MSMRLFVLPVALLLVAACTTTPATPPSANDCNAEAVKAYIGQAATANVIESARRAAGARIVRTLKPDQMVTMEYLEGRLNLHVDAGNVLLRATCG